MFKENIISNKFNLNWSTMFSYSFVILNVIHKTDKCEWQHKQLCNILGDEGCPGAETTTLNLWPVL
jgi:hypothetical protein